MFLISSPYVLVSIAIGIGYLLYRAVLPKPIPGNIPYDKTSARRLLGDIPDVLKHRNETGDTAEWMNKRCRELNSPIIQLFLSPYGRPSVVVADCREAHDILARRTREFDRAQFFSDLFVATGPHNQVCMPTNDQWHTNRRLMADTMSPGFLSKSAAPQVGAAFSAFIDLWKEKADLAHGHPFNAEQDVDTAMLDAITAAAFGTSSEASRAQLEFLLKNPPKRDAATSDQDREVVFARAPAPVQNAAIETIAHSSQLAAESLFGANYHRFGVAFFPYLRKAMKQKDIITSTQIQKAWKKFSSPGADNNDVKSATELIVSREVAMAKKEGRKPDLDNPVVGDELFGFLIAGFDTTATTIKWGLKLLAKYQHVQVKVRDELRTAFKTAVQNGTIPSAEEILRDRPPYLDAVIEEILRLGDPSSIIVRTATTDTQIFGHFIPKGCDVAMINSGHSYTEPAIAIDESLRSDSSRKSKDTAYNGDWDPSTLGEFRPERWLTRNERGEEEFNPRAGPQQTFGGGVRGCFGRRLAYVILRVVWTLILLNFDLQPLPEDLASLKAKIVLLHTPVSVFVRVRTLNAAKAAA